MGAPLMLDALAEVLVDVVTRHGSVRDSGENWMPPHEVVSDDLGNRFTVAAALHPAEARDAARDTLDRLALHGLDIHRMMPKTGNTLSAKLARLSAEIAMANGRPSRLKVIAGQMAALAEEAAEHDVAVVPAHLRMTMSERPAGVVTLADRRRA